MVWEISKWTVVKKFLKSPFSSNLKQISQAELFFNIGQKNHVFEQGTWVLWFLMPDLWITLGSCSSVVVYLFQSKLCEDVDS